MRAASIAYLRSLLGAPAGATIYDDTIREVLGALDESNDQVLKLADDLERANARRDDWEKAYEREKEWREAADGRVAELEKLLADRDALLRELPGRAAKEWGAMTTIDRLEALLAAHGTNPMAFVGELNALGIAALPALVRVAKAARAFHALATEDDPDHVQRVGDELTLAFRALDEVQP